jgi:hypothetical protein
MKATVTYQGYRNAQTWSVALILKNEESLHKAALLTVKRESQSHTVCEVLLHQIASRNFKTIVDSAPWAWDEGQSLNDVDWRAIRVEMKGRIESNGQ